MRGEEYIKTGGMNKGIREFWMPNWIWNATENKDKIKQLYYERGDKLDLAHMPRPPVGPNGERIPALILGSGPSFARALPHLRFWRGAIFATPSHCRVLDLHKRHPDYILALDTSTRVPDQFGNIEFHGTNLLTHPSMCTELFDTWKWRDNLYLFRMFEPENEILESIYDSLYPYIQARVINSGCVANNSIIIANNLGYAPLYLCGVDFGYPTPRQIWNPEDIYEEARPKRMPGETEDNFALRFDGWKTIDDNYKKDPELIYQLKGVYKHQLDLGWLRFRDYVDIGKYVYEPKPLELSNINSLEDYKKAEMPDGTTCFTTPTNLFYRSTLMANWKMMHYNIVNCSYGILRATDIPFCHIEEVVRNQGQNLASKEGDPHYMSWDQIDKAADSFTIPRGIYAKYSIVNEQPVIRGLEIVDSIFQEIVEAEHRLNMLRKLSQYWSFDEEAHEWSRTMQPEDSPRWLPPEWKEELEKGGNAQ